MLVLGYKFFVKTNMLENRNCRRKEGEKNADPQRPPQRD
jgi:hypothetical protein